MSEMERDLRILEALEDNPELTQSSLAAQLGVAVGSVNWYLRRLIRKGYVKVTHLQRRKMKYFVTPEGLALKGHLTMQYMKASLRVYRELREAAHEVLAQVRHAGHMAVWIPGHDEADEILRLTCLEDGVSAVKEPSPAVPVVQAEGAHFTVVFPAEVDPDAPHG